MFITLLSVLIGLVLADLVSEARVRLILWPLTLEALRTLGQILAHASSAFTAWVVYAHIGVSRVRMPTLADSVVAFIVPLTLVLAMPLIGREEIWPWFYYASFSLVISLGTNIWLLYLSRHEQEMVHLNYLLRTRGYFSIFYTGIPIYAIAGWLDQLGYLSVVHELIFSAIPLPSAVMAAYLFLRDWRQAVTGGNR